MRIGDRLVSEGSYEPDRIRSPSILRVISDHTLGFVCSLILFSHFSYARLYLGSVAFAPFALLHYCILGRDAGLRPNPLFDPAYFREQAGCACFLRYMCDRRYWHMRPSGWFSPQDGGSGAALNPLARFLLLGRGGNGSSRFDGDFVRSAVCRDRIQKRWMLFKLAADRQHELPMTANGLFAAQRAFRSSIEYKILRSAPSGERRNLVFIQAGAGFDGTGLEARRDFDVMLNYYETPGQLCEDAEIVTWQAGTKTTAISTVLDKNSDLILRYDAVLFLDDDIRIDCRQIDLLFAIFKEENLDLAQPSLTEGSSCYFRCLKQPAAGRALRRMNGVEIMMPLVSRRVLREFGWVFAEGVSGWGVDLLLSAKVRERFGDTIALIGEVVVAHERPVDTAGGQLYRALRQHGIDANTEAGDIVRRHALPPYARRIRPVIGANRNFQVL